MATHIGKYEKRQPKIKRRCPYSLIFLSFFLVELFAFCHLQPADGSLPLWPLAFGALWSVIFGALLSLLPEKPGRIVFGALFSCTIVYAVGQTGYYQLFSEMMWLSDFRYVSEGADYWSVILSYPVTWFLWVAGLLGLGGILLRNYPRRPVRPARAFSLAAALIAGILLIQLPEVVFEQDEDIRYAQSDYGRMQSSQAAYENMFNVHRLYQVCGTYQTLVKDIAHNFLPEADAQRQEEARKTIGEYFDRKSQETGAVNEMTGILKDKNVILVLMESMDDWMIGEHTPTIRRLMEDGINFTNFYTPPYGGIRTFNTEFCLNTGSFLSSQGGYAFDYVTNDYSQSLASLLRQQGYSAKTFHYNAPSFYSRDVFSEAMGYEEYVWYEDYLTQYTDKERKQLLYDDTLVLTEPALRQEFFRDGKTFNFLITRSAHLSYKYNEVLSHWGLKKYPEYFGMTGHEETDCALLKARLVEDLFRQLLISLEEEGKLEDTVIIGVTDHYTYGYKDEAELLRLSGVEHKLLLERTPFFVWSPGLTPKTVDKVLNTSDFLPTVLNMLDVDSDDDYIGRDAFDESYEGYAFFSDGSWITNGIVCDASKGVILKLSDDADDMTEALQEKMSGLATAYITINNLILESDYYGK